MSQCINCQKEFTAWAEFHNTCSLKCSHENLEKKGFINAGQFGWLKQEKINAMGLVKKNNEWFVPMEEKIAEEKDSAGRQWDKGDFINVISPRFISNKN